MRVSKRWLPVIIGGLTLTPAALAQDEAARTPAEVEAATALMDQVGKAYAAAPAMTDSVKFTTIIPDMGEQSFVTSIRFDRRDVEVKRMVDMFDVHVVEGVFYLTTEMSPDGMLKAELGDDPSAAIKSVMGAELDMFGPPHLMMRLGGDSKNIASTLGFGLVEDPVIAGHHMVKTDAGTVHEVIFDGKSDATLRVHVDPATHLILGSHARGLPEGYPGDEPLVVTTVCAPKVVERLAKPITFDPGEREVFASLDEMMAAAMGGGMGDMNPSVAVGAEAPSFTLVDQNGERHSLSDYRGKVVLLDWWGIW